MNGLKKMLVTGLAVCLLQLPAIGAFAEGNVLQNQAVNGGVINQNIVFIDVKSDHWAREAISDMARRGVINGYEDESFKPDNSISREEFAKLISLTFSLDLTNGSSYSDVPSDRWSAKYIEAAKDYLTGYYPPKGQPFFSPETKATREDVAVALVKVLGLKDSDLKDSNILKRKFNDADDVSYGLRKYVALAIERGLISGYEDDTFRPEAPITRAEVATLLYRTIKSSAQDQTDGPVLKVNVSEITAAGTFYVSGTVSEGATVSINGEEVQVEDGAFKEGYKTNEEGTFAVAVVAKYASGKTTTVNKTVTYKLNGPVLTINDTPDSTDASRITLSGKVSDKTDNAPVVYLNDQKLSFWSDSFETSADLKEGENTFVFKAKNSAGKTTTVTKTVTYTANGPILKVDDIPETTDRTSITVSGKVTDKNDYSPSVYLNDEKLSSWSGTFEKTVNLQEGENTLVFKAKNSAGKTTTITKRITLSADGPRLQVDDIPAVVDTQKLTISGKITDKNDYSPSVYVNDEKLSSWSNTFEKSVTLQVGENTIVIKGKNSAGKTTIVTKTVVFQPAAPILKLDYIPDRSAVKTLNLSGSATDKNDYKPVVYLNDEKISDSWSNSFSKTFTLQSGANELVFKAVNTYGKATTVTKTVYYQN